MKDFIKKYHNKKIIWNLWIVVASLVMAIGINFFVIDWSELWNNLKASVINSQNIENNNHQIVVMNFELYSFIVMYNTVALHIGTSISKLF